MSRLRICHVIFSSGLNGSERHVVDLANSQAQMGHEVHVVGKLGSPIRRMLTAGIKFHGGLWPRYIRSLWVRSVLRRIQPDVCHAHLGRACRALLNVRQSVLVATMHVGYKPHHHDHLDGVISLNRQQMLDVLRSPVQSRLVYNWPPALAEDRNPTDLRSELALPADQWLVGAVARLHPSKGLDLLIRAFLDLDPQNALLVLAGEGEQRSELERLIGADPRVRLLGQRSDVDRIMRGLDLFVMPSYKESMSLAVLEAMRAGVPIIASANQGALDALEGQPATLVPVSDAAALGQAMLAFIGSPRPHDAALRPRIVYNMAAFDRVAGVTRITDFYRELLAQRGSAPAKTHDA